MTEKKQFRAIKGVRDILPPDTALWNHVEQTARDVFTSYDFGEIRLPIFEQTELFARSIGVETDVVNKEMYSFEDHNQLELEQHRAGLILRRPKVDDLAGLSGYERSVVAYIERVEGTMARGEIPRTPENHRAIEAVKVALKHMNSYAENYVNAPSGSDANAFEQFAKGVSSALRSIHFGDVVALRPEATASVARAYIEHGMQTLPGNAKLYYMGPMFRRERPQKGRYRQFYQIGAEVLGQSDAPGIDAEVIEMLLAFFEKVGLKGATLYVNSIGHSADNCRRGYVEKLRAELIKVKDKLGPDSQRRIETNPLRVLDSKLPEEQPIIETLPRIADHLCDDCRAHFAKLQEELNLRGISYEINWRLVRGLDYYMRTTFEITAPGLGSQNAVCGGGRYDGLVELLGGQPTKGIGFAIGEDRLILSLQEQGAAQIKKGIDVFVAWMGDAAYPASVKLARLLRDAGLSVELPAEAMKFKKSLGLADKLRARYALIVGEDEVASGQFTLKNLSVGEQQKYSESDLIDYLKSLQPV